MPATVWALGAFLMGVVVLFAVVRPRPALAAGEAPRVIIFPLRDSRTPDAPGWLGWWLRDVLADGLTRHRSAAVAPAETAALWARRFALAPGRAPLPARLQETGATVAVTGSFQTVLGMTRVRLELAGPGAPPPGERVVDLDLRRETPQGAARRVLALLKPLLPPGDAAEPPPQPAAWAPLQRFYALAGGAPRLDDAGAVERRIADLHKFSAEPALAPKAWAELARLQLILALRHLPEGAARQSALHTARTLAAQAVAGEPWHDGHRALKGELHYFLKEDYQARSEASVARLKNPLNGTAQLVLGLVAGLSTGEADERIRHALALDPFLEARNLPPGAAPIQGGVLEPLLTRWRDLRSGRRWETPAYAKAFAAGMAHFEKKEWDEAVTAFKKAQQADETRYEPILQVYRIMLETDRTHEAVPLLRAFAQEYPQQAEIHFTLGRALESSDLPGEARQAYLRAVVENPNHGEARYRAAVAAANEEHWELALESLQGLLRFMPEHEAGWVLLGKAQANLGQWEEADEALREALRLNPDGEEAKRWRARIAPNLSSGEPPPKR